SGHRRPETGEEIHERLHRASGATHHDDLGLALVDRPDYRSSDFLGLDHECGAGLQPSLVECALTESGVSYGPENNGGPRHTRLAVVVSQHATEGDESIFAGGVGLREGKAGSSRDRGDVDDTTVTALEHAGKHQSRQRDR